MQHNYSSYLEKSLEPFSRRAFLKGSIFTGVGAATALSLGCSKDSAQIYRYMSNEDAGVISKLVETMFPESIGIHPASEVAVMENINHLLGFVDEKLRGDLSAGIKLFNYGAIVLGLHFASFTELSPRDAQQYANDWQNGNDIQRGLLAGLKKLIYTAYWRDPKTWDMVEFDGPVSDKWGLTSLGNTPMPSL